MKQMKQTVKHSVETFGNMETSLGNIYFNFFKSCKTFFWKREISPNTDNTVASYDSLLKFSQKYSYN